MLRRRRQLERENRDLRQRVAFLTFTANELERLRREAVDGQVDVALLEKHEEYAKALNARDKSIGELIDLWHQREGLDP